MTADTVGVRRLLPLILLACAALPAEAGAVINGTVATRPADLPWQVAVRPDGALCGGSLIAPDLVVTAAHCTEGLTPSKLSVRANSSGFGTGGDERVVTEIANHPDTLQSSESPRRDVALLKLASAVPGPAAAIAPITEEDLLGDTGDDPIWQPGDPVTVSGWGITEDGDVSANLRHAEMDRFSDNDCENAWFDLFDASDMVCALTVINDNPVPPDDVIDSCNGDSGGPLVAPTTGVPVLTNAAHWKLVGVVSFGSPDCDEAELPGVYARVGASIVHDFITDATPTFMPYPTDPPQISGTPAVGQTLSCTQGTWANGAPPTTYEYAFFRGGQLAQSGAQTTYTVTSTDQGRSVKCRVIAENEGGVASQDSNSLAVPPAPSPAAPPAPPAPTPPAPEPAPPVVQQPPVILPAPDKARPRSELSGRVCRRRICTIAVFAEDRGTAGIRTVLVTLSRKKGRRTIRYRVRVRRLSTEDFELRTPRLPAGRYTLSVTAIDRANNRQRTPTTSRFRIRAGR